MNLPPTLQKVIIREKDKNNESGWHTVYTTEYNPDNPDGHPITGVWLAESDPSSPSIPASRRLQLLTTNPLINTMHSTGMTGYFMINQEVETDHLSKLILADYPDLVVKKQKELSPLCINFSHPVRLTKDNKFRWAGLIFKSSSDFIIDANCLQFSSDLNITFPEKIVSAEITFCMKIGSFDLKTFNNSDCSVLINTQENHGSNNIIQINSVDNPFACLQFDFKKETDVQILSICYISEKMKNDFDRNENISENNINNLLPLTPTGNQYVDEKIFKPGRYYEIEVVTQISGELIEDRIKEEDPLIREFIVEKYEDNLFPRSWTSYTYFQTEAPPQNLEPYIKWSLPKRQENKVFINDPIEFRFKRGYLNILFGPNAFSDHQIKVYLKDVNGIPNPIPNSKIKWLSSNKSTLFPDEETWQDHLSLDQISISNKPDDILSINLTNLEYFKPKNRYELLLIGMKREDITDDNAKNKNVLKLDDGYYNVLTSVTFTTSRFDSFAKVFLSGVSNAKINPVVMPGNTSSFTITNFDTITSEYIEKEKKYYKTVLDYEYGMAQSEKNGINLVSKEAVENEKLALRAAADTVDDQFRSIALELNSDVLFADIENKLKVYAIHSIDNKYEIIWIKLPEPLKLKMNSDSLERFTCELLLDSDSQEEKIFNSDTSQIIFKLREAIDDLSRLSLKITYIKDFGDDTRTTLQGSIQNNHHRYDRPSLKGINPGTTTVEGITINTVEEQGVIMETIVISFGENS